MKQHGNIDFKLLDKSGLSVMEWLFLQQLAFLSNGYASRKINGWVTAKQKTIASHLGVSDRTVRSWTMKLEESKWIEKDHSTGMIRTSQKWHNLLTMKNDDEAEETSKESGNNFLSDVEETSAPTIKRELEGRVKQEVSEKTYKRESYTKEFEEAWKLYGRRGSKESAFSIYKKKKINTISHIILLAAIDEHKREKKDVEAKYIPHFQKFLKDSLSTYLPVLYKGKTTGAEFYFFPNTDSVYSKDMNAEEKIDNLKTQYGSYQAAIDYLLENNSLIEVAS